MLSIIVMLALISVLIIAHELGHFWVAKKSGVRVERFGFGLPFGPTLWSKKVGDTEYCIHAALFGGYVSFPDDNPESDIPENSPERFENQPLLNRAAIAIAGVTVNAILGYSLMTFVILGWGISTGDIQIGKVLSANNPAAQAGLTGGEIIRMIDGKPVPVNFPSQQAAFVSKVIHQHAGQPLVITVEKDRQQKEVTVTPDQAGMIGIQLTSANIHEKPVRNPIEAAQRGAEFLNTVIVMNFQALGRMVSGQVNPKELSGPLMIVNAGAHLMDKGGIQEGLRLTAIISVVLAVMNLLPMPALDGGHLLFMVIEALTGKPLRKEVQERFVQAGFLVLLGLMAFILWNDVNNIWIHPVKFPQ